MYYGMGATHTVSACMKNPRRYSNLIFGTGWILLLCLVTWRMRGPRQAHQTRTVSAWVPPSKASLHAKTTGDLQQGILAPPGGWKFPEDGSSGAGSRWSMPPAVNSSAAASWLRHGSLALPKQPPSLGPKFLGKIGCSAGREVFNLSMAPLLPASEQCRAPSLPRTDILGKDWFHDKIKGMCAAKTGAGSGSTFFEGVFGHAGGNSGGLPMHIVTLQYAGRPHPVHPLHMHQNPSPAPPPQSAPKDCPRSPL